MRRFALLAAALLLSIPGTVFAGNGKIRPANRPVPNEYIVVLEEDAAGPDLPSVAAEIAQENAGKVIALYDRAFKGFLIRMPAGRALAMSHDPRVALVEENGWMRGASATQTVDSTLWNLDRIDQLNPNPLSLGFTYHTTGAGVTAYVIDTGILAAHPEFQTTRQGVNVSRVVRGANFAPNDIVTDPLAPCGDGSFLGQCQHGSMVASTLGGKTTGVAKDVTLVSVRVLNRNLEGTAGDIILGINWVLSDHSANPGPAVANMSIFDLIPPYGNDITLQEVSALETAVGNMINAGITVTASANNQDNDACRTTPARLARNNTSLGGRVITVGGTMLVNGQDNRWVSTPGSFGSNWGTCVDIFAPAHNIKVARYPNLYTTLSGTSFAAPLVAGVAALHLQNATTATPDDVWNTLKNNANNGRLAAGTNPLNGSVDRMIYSNWSSQSPSYEGYLDAATCSSIFGWAWDANQPNSPINVDIYDGSTRLTTLWANQYRAGLGKGNNYHGYSVSTPNSLKNGQYHTIRAKYAGTDSNLYSTPKTLICNVSIFTTQTPAQFLNASPGYEVGTQFSSSVSGTVTELRFYRSPNETGTNTLRLWSDGGGEMAQGSVSSGSGWVTVDIPDKAITAGTLYRVSVNTNTSQSKTDCGLSPPITNGPLTAHQGLWGQPMGAKPNNGSCSNFFVDVVFSQ